MKMQPEIPMGRSSILYRGHALSDAETLAFRPTLSWCGGTLPLILSGWVALGLFMMMPAMALATIAGTPIVYAMLDRLQRA